MSHDETETDNQQPRRLRLLFSVAAIVLALDVATKIIAVAALEDREPVRLLGGAVYLALYRNPGAAFSMATGMTWLLTIVAITVVVVIIRLSRNLRSLPWALGLGLVLGGALGNLIDRLFRAPGPMRGHVVDFVSLFAPDGSVWPVFNVADPAIVGGAAFLVVLTFLGYDPDGQRHSKKENADNEGKR
ncbi:signal peptidase II [Hoyosella sp. YIM 151337]|uniref:signal peptidase II n=1 Tax=Hoyosella sp. YIM 151337 TaxID=2992742 RepID=UPI0022365945|nr:signal peptidase II [Hoyosella sp. YIM 151337]MCW4355471.1 signal peptidase II [Hoyosella sp. YIM 151337]